MKQVLAALILLFVAPIAHAEYLIRTSPINFGTTSTLVLYISTYDQYNVNLSASTPIQFTVPIISGAIAFRVKLCENAIGGYIPTFSSTSVGGSAPAIVAPIAVMVATTANQCSVEKWVYDQSLNQIQLEAVTPASPFYNWNNIIDVRAFGCHGDMNPQPGHTPITVVATNGSATLTAAANTWTGADRGKLINVFDESAFEEVFSGTIQTFNSTSSVALNTTLTVVNGHTFQAEWATADDTCLSNINAAIATTSILNGFHIIQSVPIAMSQPFVALKWNGIFEGFGCASTPIVWFSATPDQDIWSMAANVDTTYRNMCIVGGSYAPPRSGIQFRQRPGLSDTPNIRNHLIDTAVGSQSTLYGNLPVDNGQGGVGVLTGNISAGATSLTLVSMPAFGGPGGPGPDQVLEIVDTSSGATEGNEVVITSHTYTRGANPIVLSAAVNRAHTAANTVVLIAQPPINNCYYWDNQSTQNDKNVLDHTSAKYCNVAYNNGQGNSTGFYIHGGSANGALVGLYNIAGGGVALDSMEWEAVGIEYAIGNNSNVVVNGDNGPAVAGGGTFGPGYVFSQFGGTLKFIDIPGFTNLSTFTCISCGVDLVGTLNLNSDIINTGIGQSETLRFLNTKFSFDANSSITPPIFPSIHTYSGTVTRDVIFEYEPAGTNYAHVVVTDPGIANNSAVRRYRLCREPSTIGDGSVPCSDIIYRGSEAAADSMGELDFSGLAKHWGAVDVKPLDATQNLLAASCTGASGGATDYWYRYAWSVSDGEGHTLLQKANTTGTKLTCVSAPSGGTPVNATAFNVRGGQILHLYRASCADPCSDPGTEGEVATQTVGNTPSASFGLNTIQDVGTAPGTAMPTSDSTGVLTVAGNLHRTAVTVANLPSTCAAGDTAAVTDWNGTNGACTGGSTNYVVATCGASNNWFCP